jgi:hypothetical protein
MMICDICKVRMAYEEETETYKCELCGAGTTLPLIENDILLRCKRYDTERIEDNQDNER